MSTFGTPILILAGGKGSRLGPLTVHRAKPSVPFGGRYRIVDFVLSNLRNSGYQRIYVLTQYMAHSLIRHLTRNWGSATGLFLEIAPAQMRKGEFWYRGTADAVYQNLNLIEETARPNVGIFSGDHIYKFAIDQMEAYHDEVHADLTVAAYPVPRSEAHQFGVIQVDDQGRIVGFQEKPADPTPIPGDPNTCLVSMGNYFFRCDVLRQALLTEVRQKAPGFDFGKNVIPRLLDQGGAVYAYDFATNRIPGEPDGARPYWRDVGTIDSYFQANIDLRSPLPTLNLYNREWRIRAAHRNYPPARFVRHGEKGSAAQSINSLICEGSIVSSATLHQVLLGYDCFVHAGSTTEDSVLLSGCDVGADARMRMVLFDKNCSVAPGAEIGYDDEADRARFPFISEGGVIVLPKGTHVPRQGPIVFAHDMADMLESDPATREAMSRIEYTVSERSRRSHHSAGPRYQRFGPGALSGMGRVIEPGDEDAPEPAAPAEG